MSKKVLSNRSCQALEEVNEYIENPNCDRNTDGDRKAKQARNGTHHKNICCVLAELVREQDRDCFWNALDISIQADHKGTLLACLYRACNEELDVCEGLVWVDVADGAAGPTKPKHEQIVEAIVRGLKSYSASTRKELGKR